MATHILKHGADLLDPITLIEPPNRTVEAGFAWLFDEEFNAENHDPYALHTRNHAVEVSEPREFMPKYRGGGGRSLEFGIQPERWRVSESYGYLCRGPVIADRPAEEFLDIVSDVLDAVGPSCDQYLTESDRQTILDRAEAMKRTGDAHDVTIMAEVVRCIEDRSLI